MRATIGEIALIGTTIAGREDKLIMVRLVDVQCSTCTRKFSIGENRNIELTIKQQKPVCAICNERAKDLRIADFKQKLAILPAEMRHSIEIAAIRKLLMQSVGEETYWRTMAEMIKE